MLHMLGLSGIHLRQFSMLQMMGVGLWAFGLPCRQFSMLQSQGAIGPCSGIHLRQFSMLHMLGLSGIHLRQFSMLQMMGVGLWAFGLPCGQFSMLQNHKAFGP
jgi:hypothetical protein